MVIASRSKAPFGRISAPARSVENVSLQEKIRLEKLKVGLQRLVQQW
jgi:hypothetical protein